MVVQSHRIIECLPTPNHIDSAWVIGRASARAATYATYGIISSGPARWSFRRRPDALSSLAATRGVGLKAVRRACRVRRRSAGGAPFRRRGPTRPGAARPSGRTPGRRAGSHRRRPDRAGPWPVSDRIGPPRAPGTSRRVRRTRPPPRAASGPGHAPLAPPAIRSRHRPWGSADRSAR